MHFDREGNASIGFVDRDQGFLASN
jgi:hypothetical protein